MSSERWCLVEQVALAADDVLGKCQGNYCEGCTFKAVCAALIRLKNASMEEPGATMPCGGDMFAPKLSCSGCALHDESSDCSERDA